MTATPEIWPARPRDLAAVVALVSAVFPDEDLAPLVAAIARMHGALSLVATGRGGVIGHAAWTPCDVGQGRASVWLLGPVAVSAGHRGRGIGSRILADGHRRLSRAGPARVLVLGDPAFYGRHGFRPEHRLAPPHPLPPAWRSAWQSLGLLGAPPAPAAQLRPPQPWRARALWSS